MSTQRKSGPALAIALVCRMEELLNALDDIESKINNTPDEDVDRLVRYRALAALSAARRPLDIFLSDEGVELTPTL